MLSLPWQVSCYCKLLTFRVCFVPRFSNECISVAGTFTKCQCNIGYIIFGKDLGEICCMQQFWSRFGELYLWGNGEVMCICRLKYM